MPQPTPTPAPAPPTFTLPDLEEVDLVVADIKGSEIDRRPPSGGGGGGGSTGIWLPRTAAEVERDQKVGHRGEALVYRQELERVRAMGYADPERLVIWTSRADPGADHDIRSVDDKGRTKWIEVKSTTGVDGRFDWSRKEFEKALRERDVHRGGRLTSGHPIPLNPVDTGSSAPTGRAMALGDSQCLQSNSEPFSTK